MVYDCFIFFNELDLLELRFRELECAVDRFVVVEATTTFSGRPKPLVFAENRGRYRKWQSRIVHVIVRDMPAGSDPWCRERHQRNAIRRGLKGAAPGDGVIISDADEIPSATAVRRWRPDMGVCRFQQMFCYYWLNCVGGTWTGSRILSVSMLDRFPDIDHVRRLECPVLENGGWHFSYLGRTEGIREKLESYSHQDLNIDRFKDHRYISQVTTLGIDLFSRPGMIFRFCEIDDRFPAAIREDPQRYAHLVRNAMFHEDWYPPDQLMRLAGLCESVRPLHGAVMEIGCWEGRSTVAMAHACHPEVVLAIDTWRGNEDENTSHGTVYIARTRDVYGQFLQNIAALTGGNVRPVRQDCHDFLKEWREPVKLAHIDGSHDYQSVRRTLDALLPWMVPGGILCGDDFLTACASRRDLDGGVERAVREALPAFQTSSNLWWCRKPGE